MTRPLEGKVALVAGATRGAGRGIALELGLAGAIVYCTGRSSRESSAARRAGGAPFDLAQRPETIEETAELVQATGGSATAVRVDHTKQSEVEALVGRIEREHGRLEILVNDIWGGDELTEWEKPFWQADADKGFLMLERAVNTHIITSRHAVPLMLRKPGGLIVEITDGAGMYYRGNAFYDLAKSSVIRLAFVMAEELRDSDIAVVALTPGFLRSEAMLQHFGITERNWRDAVAKDSNFALSETPRYIGRALVALAADPNVREESGRGFSTWGLQSKYGFSDVDGASPNWGAHAAAQPFGMEQVASHERFLKMFGPLGRES